MATELAFTSLDRVEQRLRLLKQERDQHYSLLRQHLEALKDHEHRGLLMKDAVHDLLHAWRPAEVVRAALEPAKGLMPLLVQFAGMRGGFKRRLFWTVASVAAPALLKRVDVGKLAGLVAGFFRGHDHKTNGKAHGAGVPEEKEDPLAP